MSTAAAKKPAKKRTKIAPVSTLVDGVLTAVYAASTAFTFYALRHELALFLGLLVVTAGGIVVTMTFFRIFGQFVSRTFLKGSPFNDPLSKRKAVKKWCDQSWQLVIHVSMTVFELYILSDEDWFWVTKNAWIPHPDVQPLKFSLKLFYIVQLAIWVYTAFSHRFLMERAKDYIIMYVHHICTIILVAGSYYCNFHRIGVLVLVAHDMSDIPVDVMKMINYLKLQDKAGFFLSEGAFAINLVSWVYLRFYHFGYRILYSSFYESHIYCGKNDPGNPWADIWDGEVIGVPFHVGSNLCLAILASFHIWWFFLFLRIGYRVLTGSIHEGAAEHYEGDSDDDEKHD